MLFKTIAPLAAALALASPIQVEKRNAPDCPGDQYCRGAILEPANGSVLDLAKPFLFKYETNPNVTTLSVTPQLSYTGRAPSTYDWDPINVTDGAGTVEAYLTIPSNFTSSGSDLWLYGLDNQTTGDDGKTVIYASESVTVHIK